MAYGSSYGMASRDIVLCLLLPAFLCSSFGGTMPQLEVEPEFLAPLENHTVTQGRDVSFTCVVNHLQSYKVAWIKSDSRAILAIHTHMVAHNTRLSVTHNGHNTWKLHVTNVQPSDSGTYMCQVNSDPMRSQMGYMKVVIPPDIIDLDDSADRLTTEEGGELLLRCRATGTPKPGIIWRREDGGNIILRDEHGVKQEKSYEGEQLRLTGVQRQQMGSYLCIATNGVPPTVSKRYSVHVHFKPLIKVVNQLVAAPLDSDVVLQCYVESSPKAMNTWYKNDGVKLLPKEKYEMSEISITDYSYQLNLTIRRLSASDFGSYTCSSENAFGRAEGTVRLQELRIVKVTVPTIQPTLQIMKGESKDKPAVEEKRKKDSSTWEGAKTGNDLDGKKLSASGATPMVRGHSSKDSRSSGNLKLPAHHPAPSPGPVHSTPAAEVTESAAPWKQSTMSGATLTIAILALLSCI